MRTPVARALWAIGIMSLLGNVWWAIWVVIPAHRKMVETSDGAGYSLALFALLLVFLPLAATFCLGALLLDPPAWVCRLWEEGTASELRADRRWGLYVTSAVVLMFVVMALWVTETVRQGMGYYDGQGTQTVAVLAQNVVLLLPMATLVGLLTVVALRFRRASRAGRSAR